jgi:hypothetical protein
MTSSPLGKEHTTTPQATQGAFSTVHSRLRSTTWTNASGNRTFITGSSILNNNSAGGANNYSSEILSNNLCGQRIIHAAYSEAVLLIARGRRCAAPVASPIVRPDHHRRQRRWRLWCRAPFIHQSIENIGYILP